MRNGLKEKTMDTSGIEAPTRNLASTVKKTLLTTAGALTAGSGLAAQIWLLAGAETTGRGLALAVKVFDLPVPALLLMFSSYALMVIGLVVFVRDPGDGASTATGC